LLHVLVGMARQSDESDIDVRRTGAPSSLYFEEQEVCPRSEVMRVIHPDLPRLCAASTAATLLAACASSPPAGPPPSLAGTEWILSRIDGRTPDGADTLTARFGVDGRIEGDSGCNNFSGPFIQTSDTVRIGELLSTRRACADTDRQQQETRILRLLQGTNTLKRTGDNRVTLSSDDGTLVLTPAVSIAVASATQTRPLYPRRAMYDCDGVALTVVFEEKQAALTWSGGHDVLDQRGSGTGYWYESTRNSVRGGSAELTWTQEGRSPRTCEVLR
jgi:heat shock protein HslJ